jgi:outer membrane protein
MNWNRVIVLLLAVGFLGWGLGATDDVVKLGVVDLDQAVTSTDEGRKARDEFERKKREAEAKLQPLHERAQGMLKEFEAKRFVLSEDALYQKQLDLAEIKNEIESKRREIQGQLEVDRERLVGPLRQKLTSVVEEVGRTKGFSMIISRGAPGVMYTREALDITDLVIESFNKKG